MGADLDVFVVLNEQTRLWDAACCNEACGPAVHSVSDDNSSRTTAEKAATRHRAEIRKAVADKAARAAQVEQGTAAYWQDIARQRERETRRVERDLEAARAAIARVRAEHAAIHADMDDYATRHNPACECEVIPSSRQTADRILAALEQHQETGHP